MWLDSGAITALIPRAEALARQLHAGQIDKHETGNYFQNGNGSAQAVLERALEERSL